MSSISGFPHSFQTKIVGRFFSDKAMKDFLQEYKENCYKKTRSRGVTDKDLLILKEYRDGAGPSELAKKHKMSINQINTAVRIAAVSKLG